MRTANITRKTGETFVKADITLDGVGLGIFQLVYLLIICLIKSLDMAL